MRANSQMKRAGASRYVSASDVRRKIQRRACFSARTVVKSSGLGAQIRSTSYSKMYQDMLQYQRPTLVPMFKWRLFNDLAKPLN